MNAPTRPSALTACASTSLEATAATAHRTLSWTRPGSAASVTADWLPLQTFAPWIRFVTELPDEQNVLVVHRHSLWKLLPGCSIQRRRLGEPGLLQRDRSRRVQSVVLLLAGPRLGEPLWILSLRQLQWVFTPPSVVLTYTYDQSKGDYVEDIKSSTRTSMLRHFMLLLLLLF